MTPAAERPVQIMSAAALGGPLEVGLGAMRGGQLPDAC